MRRAGRVLPDGKAAMSRPCGPVPGERGAFLPAEERRRPIAGKMQLPGAGRPRLTWILRNCESVRGQDGSSEWSS